MHLFFYIVGLFFLVGCDRPPDQNTKNETYKGRTSAKEIYQAKVPFHWKRIEPEDDRFRQDTTLAFASYEIDQATLTLHNFPYSDIEKRIPPEAQIERWKKQMPEAEIHVTYFAQGGFGGYQLEALTEEKGMIGYAMQLTPLLFRAINSPESDLSADYTIKFTASRDVIEKNRDDIHLFAESFEWVTPFLYEYL